MGLICYKSNCSGDKGSQSLWHGSVQGRGAGQLCLRGVIRPAVAATVGLGFPVAFTQTVSFKQETHGTITGHTAVGGHSSCPTCYSHRSLPGSALVKPIPPGVPGTEKISPCLAEEIFAVGKFRTRRDMACSAEHREIQFHLQCSELNCWRTVYVHKTLLLLSYQECRKCDG